MLYPEGICPCPWALYMCCGLWLWHSLDFSLALFDEWNCPVFVSNYRPVSLLNTLYKTFQRSIFKHIYNHFCDNDILSPLQSGFIPGDSTVYQLTYLYDTFFHALDSGKEVRVVFCDISKAFDRVWHASLIQKLKAAGIEGSLLNWFIDYRSNRKQRVTFSGVKSYWNSLKAGVPHGSILGPLLFLLYINAIVKDIGSNIRLFADDTSLYIVAEDPTVAAELLNADMEKVARWAKQWLVYFNPFKTESLLISRKTNKPDHPSIFMSGQIIKEVDTHKHPDLKNYGLFEDAYATSADDCGQYKSI